MNRRTLLKAAGGALYTVSTPLIAARQRPPVSLKKNLVLVTVDLGLYEANYRANKQDCRYTQMYFKDFKNKMTYFNGMEQPGVNNAHHSEHATFTGMDFQDRPQYPNRQFVSLDQYIAEFSLQESRHKYIYHQVSKGKNISWNIHAQAAPAYLGIDSLHNGIFGLVDMSVQKAAISKQRIVLKELRSNVYRQKKGTPQENDLIASINYQLKELDTQEKWLKVRKPRKSAKHPKDAEKAPLLHAKHSFDTIFEALKEKQTKIAVIQFGEKKLTAGLPGVSHGYHTLSHHSNYSERIEELTRIDGHILKNLSGFLEKLEKSRMLDETIVLLSCAMGDANKHSCKDIPAFLFGGGFQHKSCIECKDSNGELQKPTIQLFSSILKQIGFSDTTFSGNNKVIDELFKA